MDKQLDEIVARVQRRMSGFGVPPDKERIRAVVSCLTYRDLQELLERLETFHIFDLPG